MFTGRLHRRYGLRWLRQTYFRRGDIPFAPDVHDWGKWNVTRLPSADEDGKEERVCSYDHDLRHKQTRGVRYAFIPSGSVEWKAESGQPLILTVKNVAADGDNSTTFSRFKAVYLDGKKLTQGSDYTVAPGSSSGNSSGISSGNASGIASRITWGSASGSNSGSIILTFPAQTLKQLQNGKHSVVKDQNKLNELLLKELDLRYPEMAITEREDLFGAYDMNVTATDLTKAAYTFTLDPDGICFYFSTYDLGSYADGVQIVKLLYSAAPDLFVRDYSVSGG